MNQDSDQTNTEEVKRSYFGRKIQTVLCNWKMLVVILIVYHLIILHFYGCPNTLHSYVKKYINQRTNVNVTCADSIVTWCVENQIELSKCSWSTGTFRNHFYSMTALISRPYPDSMNNNSGLAFIRLGDGEMKLLFGLSIKTLDQWSMPRGESKLGKDLRKVLHYPKYQYNTFSPFYYGIYDAKDICPFHELLSKIYQHPKYLTYANLFVNSNYPSTKLLHQALIRDYRKKIILIINNEISSLKLTELNAWTCEILLYPNNGPLLWENDKFREQAIGRIVETAKRYRNRLFLFSIGPLSKVLIHHAWLENPYNRYIDVGSALDQMTRNRTTRPYQSNAELNHDPSYLIKFDTNKRLFRVSSVD